MQLILNNDVVFNVSSFSESLNKRELENGTSVTAMDVTVNVSYVDSLESLVSSLKDMDTATFHIKDLETDAQRIYNGFSLTSVSQNVEDFHKISTTIHFSKDYNE